MDKTIEALGLGYGCRIGDTSLTRMAERVPDRALLIVPAEKTHNRPFDVRFALQFADGCSSFSAIATIALEDCRI
ncbi:hypothetical protein [Sphingomonas sp. GB1N7]|uniref:hypothetical protein n=1 Tax=Parasphingomonas caseinilytica TaxID=3096158 RepID=UPI002FC7E8DE